MIYTFIIFIYFFISNIYEVALPTLRDHLFPLIFFVSIYKMKFDNIIYGRLILVITISLFLTDFFGLIQHFFLNEQLSQIMGRIDFIDETGYIQYTTNSARIMGFERMAGILGGGPNMFGIFNGFSIVFLSGVLTNRDKSIISKRVSKFIIFTLMISLLCIILSFSRAGWAIVLTGIIILLILNKKINRLKYFAFFAFSSFLVILIVSIYSSEVYDIIYNSVTAKEASASKRSEMITELIPIILDEPFGHGLGTTDNRYKTKLFFAESAFTNIAFEIGILGFFYLILMHFKILRQIRKIVSSNYFSKISLAIGMASLVVSFVSVNTYGMPYIYLWWFILGIGINKSNLIGRRINRGSFVLN
ncbi:O-Antigen ligase [compost metagenome]